ncbi:MAG TPA: hypothetical protein VJP45_06145 [Candidatus Limnocylindria bacterium]|nr:hypothetical protein [Candidatus Limnocylindria bacterium]
MRTVRESIFSASRPGAPDQGGGVRPSLDAHVEACCAAIRTRGRLGSALPIDPPSQRRVDHLLADESRRFGLAVCS